MHKIQVFQLTLDDVPVGVHYATRAEAENFNSRHGNIYGVIEMTHEVTSVPEPKEAVPDAPLAITPMSAAMAGAPKESLVQLAKGNAPQPASTAEQKAAVAPAAAITAEPPKSVPQAIPATQPMTAGTGTLGLPEKK